MKLIQTKNYLLLIDEEVEIREGDYLINIDNIGSRHEGVFTHNADIWDTELIDADVIKKVIAHYPLTKEAKELDLPLLPNPFEGVDINIQTRNFNKQVKNPYSNYDREYQVWEKAYIEGFDDGIAQSKQFSLEDIKKAMEYGMYKMKYHTIEAQEEFVQSLSTKKLPKKFAPEYDIVHTDHAPNGFEKLLKFKTNSEGKQEIQGKYKY